VWAHVGAEPIEITLPDTSYLTVRGRGARTGEEIGAKLTTDPNFRSDEDEVLFLGSDGNIVVFHQVADLAEYCRTATAHELVRLEWWSELAEVDEDDVFKPPADSKFDLRVPSEKGLDLVAELLDFCTLEADLDTLGDISDARKIDRKKWNTLVAEIATCLIPED